LLGILKSGAAYLPLDPSYPRERLAFMLEDAQANILLTQDSLADRIPHAGPHVLRLDIVRSAIDRHPDENLSPAATSENLAYVIYTSGSTGTPKGAMIPHRALVNYLYWANRAYQMAEGCGAPVHPSLAFDLTITGLFGPLLPRKTVT